MRSEIYSCLEKEIIMKSIIESIIGRKGINRTPELREHDIVMTNEHKYYMVLTNPDEIHFADLNPNDADKRHGILYRIRPFHGLQWLPLNQYTKTLEYQNDLNKSTWDIIAVYRGNYKWDPADTRMQCEESNLLSLIQTHRIYKLIWERK